MILEYQPIEEDADSPLSRAEFNEAMAVLAKSFENVATKDDLKELATKDDLQKFATKDDLSTFATKDDLTRYATKVELTAMEERLSDQIKASSESIVKAIARHLDTAVEDAVDRDVAPLKERVSRLEENAGLSPAA